MILWVLVSNVFNRVKDVFNAVIGRKATCEGNCSCHSLGDELADLRAEEEERLGELVEYDFSNCSPELQECIDNMLQPEGLAKLQEELDKQNAGVTCEEGEPSVGDPTTPNTPCIHMEVIFKCHVQEGDAKPANCALSTCPARAQAFLREQAKERENSHMFN